MPLCRYGLARSLRLRPALRCRTSWPALAKRCARSSTPTPCAVGGCLNFVAPDVMTWEELLEHLDNLSLWGHGEIKGVLRLSCRRSWRACLARSNPSSTVQHSRTSSQEQRYYVQEVGVPPVPPCQTCNWLESRIFTLKTATAFAQQPLHRSNQKGNGDHWEWSCEGSR